MTPADPTRTQPPKDACESVLERFEESWRRGDPPTIADFLSSPELPATAERELLAELISIDLEFRWRGARTAEETGIAPWTLEEYAKQLKIPIHELPVHLVGEEYRVRRQWGDRPQREQYLRRFGHVPANELDRVFAQIDDERRAEEGADTSVQRRSDVVLFSAPRKPQAAPHNAAKTADDFWRSLEAAELLKPERIRSLRELVPSNAASADDVGRRLVELGHLTPYQIETLIAGTGSLPLKLSEYTILSRIGEGGMGLVFRAYHRWLEREVAVKVLKPEIADDPVGLARFRREASSAANLYHPNIVGVFDAGFFAGWHYIVMEYVPGIDLYRHVEEHGKLSIELASDYLRQAAVGLAYGHAQGIVHRDIKPANLLLNRLGVIKVSDLGLARRRRAIQRSSLAVAPTTDCQQYTEAGTIVGTVDYMAPEQALNASQADARSDIYSLGCSYYYMLTGKIMFAEDTLVKRLVAHREALRPSLFALCPELPNVAQSIFERMTSRRPDDRYQTMDELLEDLHCLLPKSSRPLRSADSPAAAAPESTRVQYLVPFRQKPSGGGLSRERALMSLVITAVICVLFLLIRYATQ